MITPRFEDFPSLKVRIEGKPSLKARLSASNTTLSARIQHSEPSIKASLSANDQILHAIIEKNTEVESYYETSNEAGGTTIYIGD